MLPSEIFKSVGVSAAVSEFVIIVLSIAFLLRTLFDMEPVTAISLACNAIQVVEVSYKIVREARELYSNGNDANAKVTNLSNVTADLQDVSGRLNLQLRRTDTYGDPSPTPKLLRKESYSTDSTYVEFKEDTALRTLCEQCAGTAEELAETLKGYRVGRSGPRRRDRIPESLEVAARRYFKSGELDELNERLRNYREQLILRILIYTREEVNFSRLEQLDRLERLSRNTRELLDEGPNTRRFIQETTDTQTHVLNNVLSSYFDKIVQLLQTLPAQRDPLSSSGQNVRSDPQGLTDLNGVQHKKPSTRILNIFEAIREEQLPEISQIVERDPQAPFAIDKETGMTGLHLACQLGNRSIVLYLIRNGARINAYDNEGKTPLHHAVIVNSGPLVRELIEKGAEIDTQDNSHAVPSAYAKKWGEVDWIFRHGPKHNSLNDRQETALHYFTDRGDIDTVRSLLDQGANPNMRNRYRHTALSLACEKGDLRIMDLLISRGALIDARSDRNDTPLIRAAEAGHELVVRELLFHGADIEAHNDLKFSPLNEAAGHGHTEVVRLLLSQGAYSEHMCDICKLRPIHQGAQYGHLGVVIACLDAGVPVDSVSGDNWTALHEASRHDHPSIVELLLSRGADPNMKTYGDRCTALNEATVHNRLKITQVLLADSRTDPSIPDEKGLAPLHNAALRGYDDIVAGLIEADAPVNAVSHSGKHPLLLAAAEGHAGIVTRLVAAGSDLDLRGGDGSTALIDAAARGIASVVQILVKAGARVEVRTKAGYTALIEACRIGSEEAIRYLLDGYMNPETGQLTSQADIEHCGVSGWSALMEASHWGREDCVRLLLDRGARLDGANNGGDTAVYLAECAGHSGIVSMLKAEAGRRAVVK